MATKTKSAFVCDECGADFNKWQGQCSECSAWNSLKEVRLAAVPRQGSSRLQGYTGIGATQVQTLKDVSLVELPRLPSTLGEFDRVLGGGFVPGSVVLLGGHPGAGKSTILLQVLCALGEQCKTLYVTGEESLQQVAMRAKRLRLPMDKVQVLSETNVETVVALAQQVAPKVMVVDSVQVMHMADISSAPGSVSQVRESAACLTRFAKQTNTVLIVVGHVTKEGGLAGPKVLEHIIDCSIMVEGSHDSRFRTLRGHKNRFGAVNELGVFAMTELGMKEVANPSAIFLQRAEEVSAGSVVMATWEGTRPLLLEIQALVDNSHLGNPRRVTIGTEQNRLSMLLAVLHRHGGLMLGDQDVFVNAVGGVKIVEPGADLALIFALVSSFRDVTLPRDLVVFGEIGLAGEIRPVPSGQERLREAAKHGFKRAIVPYGNVGKEKLPGIEVVAVKTLNDALSYL